MVSSVKCIVMCATAIASPMGFAPAWADDDAAKTGIAAGLGIAAASGKTSMGDGAGAIEASLLSSDAMLQAGQAIRSVALSASAANGNRSILILGKEETVDFAMAIWVLQRMKDLKTRADALPASACHKTPVLVERTTTDRTSLLAEGTDTKKFGFARTDIVAALASDVSVGAIKLSAEDRTLIDAILMGGGVDPVWRDLSALPTFKPATNTKLLVLNEQLAADPANNPVFVFMANLQQWTDTNRQCDGDAYKAMIDTIDKLIASVTSADKGKPAIVTAAQLAPSGLAAIPLVLRVAIDDQGGTSITRSNIWYTIGLPGAAVITSGLKVSFQLSDPQKNENLMTGQIRCVTRPTSYRDVRNLLVTATSTGSNSIGDRQEKLVTCAYRTS